MESDTTQTTLNQKIDPGVGFRLLSDDERPNKKHRDQYINNKGMWRPTEQEGESTVKERDVYYIMAYRRPIKATFGSDIAEEI